MKFLMIPLLSLALIQPALAVKQKKKACKSGRTLISCEGIAGATRDAFCAKAKITEKKKEKICKLKRKTKKQNKKVRS
ncbi:MAG: hypothetical protein QF441_02480 [Bacteriovoracaceae bacterium]|jgi:hypothetical protein|nr:hypothetical protein [Halobacteriovoraceae bacterium]MDP7319440.1 hypothetical protein [Bacteriovoracaceae bacterium]|tara:strand:- start:1591 stop:1824 length:234 start_codon:yes stop_codon:yes gene_type:complete